MALSIAPETWVYAVFGRTKDQETLTAFHQQDGSIFIPILRSREEADLFLTHLPPQPGTRYEVQAILFEDVLRYAREKGCRIYGVSGKGEILEKISAD
jgi:hypothetical protein